MSWNPPNNISKKEFVGRRVFGDSVLRPPPGQQLKYKYELFLDTRSNSGLSVDRLGGRGPRRDVLEVLCPLCEESSRKRNKEFKGWAQIHVERLQVAKIGISPTPATDECNPYHAEICLDPYPTVPALKALAFQLCVYASSNEFVEKPDLAS